MALDSPIAPLSPFAVSAKTCRRMPSRLHANRQIARGRNARAILAEP